MTIGSIRSRAAVGLCALAVSCGGSKAQSPSAPGSPQCRTYATSFTRQIVYPQFSSPRETSTCVLDQTALTLTCTGPLTMSAGCTGTLSAKNVYSSLADFIAEAHTVGRVLETQEVETLSQPSACGQSGSDIVIFAYDGSKRLQSRNANPSGQGPALTLNLAYNAWDAVGRPTAGTETVPGALAACAVSVTYNDQGRTYQTSVNCPSPASTGFEQITTDANGNIVGLQTVTDGVAASTESRTIDQTASVCGSTP